MRETIKQRLEQLQADVDMNVPHSCAAPYTDHAARVSESPSKFDKIEHLVARRPTVLVIGRDFYNEDGLYSSRTAPTDVRIDRILVDAGYDLDTVGFVNAWPVLRKGSKVSGDHPMHKDKELTDVCRRRIKEIIRLFDVCIVVTLGKGPAKFISDLIGIDDLFARVAPFTSGGVVYAAISHPSYPPNRVRREKNNLCRTEQSLLEEAYRISAHTSARSEAVDRRATDQ